MTENWRVSQTLDLATLARRAQDGIKDFSIALHEIGFSVVVREKLKEMGKL